MEKTEVQHQVHLEGAIKLLTGDLQEEASRAGLDNHLQRWIEDLKAANNPEFHKLVVDLQDLKALMHSGTFNGSQVVPCCTAWATKLPAPPASPRAIPARTWRSWGLPSSPPPASCKVRTRPRSRT
ncbi:MAG: hypothetical protein WKG07_48910 [Hymenobacter sp.]